MTASGYVPLAVMPVAKLKVLGAIVGLVPVDVVDRLTTGRPSSKYLRHNHPMFGLVGYSLLPLRSILREQVDENVTVTVDEAGISITGPSGLARELLTGWGAVELPTLLALVLEAPSWSLEGLAAKGTLALFPCFPSPLIRPRFAMWPPESRQTALLRTVHSL